ncbi:glycosyltransferase family 4 protein [Flavobacterium sp. SM2513]|uniref:glycosyltransferase family 4 protein n=1 Tax=Flavobacterium sp. SM2513 TaxID=3424766 RepID=UPI003D7FE417
MKIVHLCLSCFYIDDYSYQENMLPKYHVIQGHDVAVIASLVSFDTNGKPCFLEGESTKICKDGYKVIRIDYKNPFYKLNKFIRSYNNTYKVLEKEKPDLIFMHDFSFMDITKVIKYLKKNKEVKVFVDCHTDYINSAQTWISKNIFHHLIWRYYGRKLAPYVTKFYGVTPLRCDFLKNAYNIDDEKIELLVMGVDDELLNIKDKNILKEHYNKKFNLNENDFIIVTGGKIDEKKNIHLVMQSIINLDKRNIKLIVFGTVAPEMQHLFDNLMLNDSIIYAGWLNSETILDYFIIADLVVFPGTHSVLWEQAVGVGTPCVFKYWEGMTHIDVGGNCDFLCHDTAEEITEVLKKIINDDGKYESMRKIAVEKGLKKFAYSEIARTAIEH